jgi:hypothetical protein
MTRLLTQPDDSTFVAHVARRARAGSPQRHRRSAAVAEGGVDRRAPGARPRRRVGPRRVARVRAVGGHRGRTRTRSAGRGRGHPMGRAHRNPAAHRELGRRDRWGGDPGGSGGRRTPGIGQPRHGCLRRPGPL